MFSTPGAKQRRSRLLHCLFWRAIGAGYLEPISAPFCGQSSNSPLKLSKLPVPQIGYVLPLVAHLLGYDSVWVMDHVVPDVPGTRQFTPLGLRPFSDARLRGRPDEPCAPRDERALIVPYRDPLLQAKLLSTLDTLSRGRLMVGMGVGWLR